MACTRTEIIAEGDNVQPHHSQMDRFDKSFFPHWHVFMSSKLTDIEYAAGNALIRLENKEKISKGGQMHLSV